MISLLYRLILLVFIFMSSSVLSAQLSDKTINRITSEINNVRSTPTRCGRSTMPAVHTIKWNNDLYEASQDYATYMREHDHFAHLSLEGEDAGARLDRIGYNWRYVGENIAAGQIDFPEVLQDWIKSASHCKMLMSPDMYYFAVARDKHYWVQTFATPMPKRDEH